MFVIVALVHLECTTLIRRKETRVCREDTFGELKTATDKVH